jgi:hypothetical protein
MKAFLVFGLIGLGFLLNPIKNKTTTLEESRRRCYEANQSVAEKLVAGGVWWMSQPGSVNDSEGKHLNFNISPSPVSEFYSKGMFSGLGALFPSGKYSELSFSERSKLEWKGPLEVKFEWAIGPHSEGKWIPVCCDLVVMRF